MGFCVKFQATLQHFFLNDNEEEDLFPAFSTCALWSENAKPCQVVLEFFTIRLELMAYQFAISEGGLFCVK